MDEEIQCAQKGCGEIRLFTVKDQESYAEKGYQPPRYCRTHSAQRRAAREARDQDNQQQERDNWPSDRGRGSFIPGQESDSDLLA